MKIYISKIFVVFLIFSFLLACAALIYPRVNFSVSVILTFVFGLNALGAVLPLYLLPDKNPLTIYVISMIVRMLIVSSAIVAFYYIFPKNNYFFFLHSLAVFVSFQIIEIQHLNRNKGILSSTK